MNQCDKIIRYIKDFGSITTMQAFQDLGITRLSGRIYDLKALGYQIKTETVVGRNRYGEKVHYFKYSLEKRYEQGDIGRQFNKRPGDEDDAKRRRRDELHGRGAAAV